MDDFRSDPKQYELFAKVYSFSVSESEIEQGLADTWCIIPGNALYYRSLIKIRVNE